MERQKGQPFSWGRFDYGFVAELARELAGRKVLEVFAGNGFLASRLALLGIDVLATSILSSTDRHEDGLHYPVIEMDAELAVLTLGGDRDILLMSWPPANGAALRAVEAWGEGRSFVFVGEVTDRGRNRLGGCADDPFFERTSVLRSVGSYAGRNVMDQAFIGRLGAPVPEDVPAFRP